MKKIITTIIMAAAVMCLGVSCKKDKTPEPEKKLVKITEQKYSGETLSSSDAEEFRYDEQGRLSQVINGDDITTYTYSGSAITITSGSNTQTCSLEKGKITKLATGSRNYKYIYDAENHVTKFLDVYEKDGVEKEDVRYELIWKGGNIDRYREYLGKYVHEFKLEYGEAVRGVDLNFLIIDALWLVNPILASAGYFGNTKTTRLIKSETEVLPEDSEDEPWSQEYTYTFDEENYVTSVEWTDGSWRTKLLFEWE